MYNTYTIGVTYRQFNVTAEFGSQRYEQITPGPVKREYPNQTRNPPLPQSPYELFFRCLLRNSQERKRDASWSDQDDNQAFEERASLVRDPIYTGEIESTGDGSVVIIQPGYGRGEEDYQDAIRCFKNMGYQALVMPTPWGTNIAPSRVVAESNMHFISNAADRSGKPIIIVGHSKGVLDTEVLAGLHPKEFEQTVSQDFEIRFPNRVEWINNEVLCRPNPAFSLFVSEEDLKAFDRFANSLREIKVKTVAIINPQDRIIRGTSDAQEVIINNGSHRGALSWVENLKAIWERLPKRSSLLVPAAA